MDGPLVTVVTPFYNTAPYLAECIESVLRQTYSSFEYVLISNHSTDGSDAIAARYAERDPRIRIVRPPAFLNQVQNYNFALEQLSPSAGYCKMVQADDWLFPRCLEEMVPLAEAHPSVAIVSSYRCIEADVGCVGLHPSKPVVAGREACRLQLMGKAFLFGSPTTVLYRAEVVRARRPFFAEGRPHEDTEAAFEILEHRDFGFVHQVLSFSRRQSDSLMVGARDYLPHILDRYILTRRYASAYFDADEQARYTRDATAWFYDGLARRWLEDRVRKHDEGFWEYQRKGLASINEQLRPELLAWHIAKRAARGVVTPLEVLQSVRRLSGSS